MNPLVSSTQIKVKKEFLTTFKGSLGYCESWM